MCINNWLEPITGLSCRIFETPHVHKHVGFYLFYWNLLKHLLLASGLENIRSGWLIRVRYFSIYFTIVSGIYIFINYEPHHISLDIRLIRDTSVIYTNTQVLTLYE